MPVATVDPSHYERFELKTAPADPNVEGDEPGYVMLRPLPYGMLLERQDKTVQTRMKAMRPQDRKKKGGVVEMPDMDIKTLNQVSSEFDFANCIGKHNLTDVNGQLLDFENPLTFKVLDPKIATEIQDFIDGLNHPEGAESAEDFIERHTSLHQETANLHENSEE